MDIKQAIYERHAVRHYLDKPIETEKIEAMLKEAQLRGEDLIIPYDALTTESIRCAQIIVTTLPIVIFYPFLQKYFIKGVTLGAVKD